MHDSQAPFCIQRSTAPCQRNRIEPGTSQDKGRSCTSAWIPVRANDAGTARGLAGDMETTVCVHACGPQLSKAKGPSQDGAAGSDLHFISLRPTRSRGALESASKPGKQPQYHGRSKDLGGTCPQSISSGVCQDAYKRDIAIEYATFVNPPSLVRAARSSCL